MITEDTYKFDSVKYDQFARLSSNRERIEYVLGNMLDYDKWRAETEQNMTRAKSKSAKNRPLAINFKKEAQLFMQVAQDNSGQDASIQLKEALKSMAKAILYTPPHEVSLLANLYALKSKAHFALAEYEASLYSINHSIEILEANAQAAIKLELYILKLNSLKMLRHYKEAIRLLNYLLVAEREQIISQSDFSESDLLQWQQELRLLLTDNEQEQESSEQQESNSEPYFSYRLDGRCTIVNSPVVGRHFMALDDIEQGEDILEERPYSVVMTKDCLHKRCTACHKDLAYKWHPCRHCTEVVFCDRKCALRATETFHRYECGMLSLLFVNKRGHETMAKQHVFRMVSRVGPLEAYQTEHSLPDYCIDHYLAEPNQRDLPELAKSTEEKNRAYKMSTTLWNHNSKHGVPENLLNTIEAIDLTVALDLVHHFRDEEPSDEFLLDFIEMIFLDVRRIGFNVFGWQLFGEKGELEGYVANSQCLVGALINHSCVPNAVWVFNEEGAIRFVAFRPIHKGDEITISYGASDSMSYNQRQSRLNLYYFACKCAACFEDARSAKNIRCLQCSGPVVYDSALNLEPWLNGKCILCYSEYHDLKQTIQRLSTAKQSIKSVKSIGLLMEAASAESMIGRAAQLMYKLTELSLPSSKAIGQSMVDCSTAIESFGKQVNLPLQDKLSLALFMNRHLVDHLHIKKSDANTIRIFQFWFDNLVDCIVQYSSTPKQYNADEAAMWSAMLNMSAHLKQAIQSQMDSFERATGTEPCIQVLQQIVDRRVNANEQAVAQCIRDYGGHLLSESLTGAESQT